MSVDLGKYAVEVLLAYGVTFGALLGLTWWSWWQARQAKAAFEREKQLQDRHD